MFANFYGNWLLRNGKAWIGIITLLAFWFVLWSSYGLMLRSHWLRSDIQMFGTRHTLCFVRVGSEIKFQNNVNFNASWWKKKIRLKFSSSWYCQGFSVLCLCSYIFNHISIFLYFVICSFIYLHVIVVDACNYVWVELLAECISVIYVRTYVNCRGLRD